MSQKPRVCIIGCGPMGMFALYHFAKLPDTEIPDIVCYEKQKTWGGQWNTTWNTGTDEYGEHVQSAIYPQILNNVPKEIMEFPDYTFHQHFGRALPSYVDPAHIRAYMEGRMTQVEKGNLQKLIKFSTVVRNVDYNKDEQRFSVTAFNLLEDRTYKETGFTHIIVATGIFAVPRFPLIDGSERFKGRILHSREFKQASEFAGRNILILGSSYSAQDMAQITLKNGADHVICSWRSSPTGYKWPHGIEERPQVERLDEHSAYFSDGTMADIDVVIFCTGYQKRYPFLPDELRLKDEVSYYPDSLYKGILWIKGGDDRLLYLGQQYHLSFPMFDVQALWACKYITGKHKIPEKTSMLEDIAVWRKKLETVKDTAGAVDFQTDYLLDLSFEVGYENEFQKTNAQFHEWIENKNEDMGTFRDKQFISTYSGVLAEPPEKPWLQTF